MSVKQINTPFGPLNVGQKVLLQIRVSTAPIVRQTAAEDYSRSYVPVLKEEHTTSFLYTQTGNVVSFDGKLLVLTAIGEASVFEGDGKTKKTRVCGTCTRKKLLSVPAKGIVKLSLCPDEDL